MNSPVSTFQILALNDAEASENRIHSDEVAEKYGFTGALVSGANVFAYMCHPLLRTYGEDWLSGGIMDVVFLKPVYQDNLLTIRTEQLASETSKRNHLTSAYNEQNVLLAKLESWLPEQLPPVSELAAMTGNNHKEERVEIAWDLIEIDEPAPAHLWQPTEANNLEHVKAQRDQSPLFSGEHALIHPYCLMDACNKALKRLFIVRAWIHTGSRMTLRKPIRVGQLVDVHAIPIKKWQRKGHQFIKLYIAMWIDQAVALEVEHTAIFRIAD